MLQDRDRRHAGDLPWPQIRIQRLRAGTSCRSFATYLSPGVSVASWTAARLLVPDVLFAESPHTPIIVVFLVGIICAVAAAPGAASVRVWPLMSGDGGHEGGARCRRGLMLRSGGDPCPTRRRRRASWRRGRRGTGAWRAGGRCRPHAPSAPRECRSRRACRCGRPPRGRRASPSPGGGR
jgi:hypothetical protein